MNPVTIEAAATILIQVAQAIQAAIAAGQTTIDAATFNEAVTLRNTDLANLDADIAKVDAPTGS